jgi:FkbM family methyltransferase
MNDHLIYDIGMHNGDDTAYYLSLGYKVISIDASPDLVKKAKLRFKNEILENKLEILNVGIDSREGEMDFYLNKVNSVWNSFDKEIGGRGGRDFEIIKVKTYSLDTIVKQKEMPYYMKIDIEGNDILCLEALFNCKEQPKYISVEVNHISLIEKLHELGYTKFKIIDQFSFLPLEVPMSGAFKMYKINYTFQHSMNLFTRVLRKIVGKFANSFYNHQLRKLFKYEHPEGSSGPFGEGLPGKWANYEEVLEIYHFYKSLFESSSRFQGYNFWIDIHATR